jgi:hypothetical protein
MEILYKEFHQKISVSVEIMSINFFTPLCKAWLPVHRFSKKLTIALHRQITQRVFAQSGQEIEVRVESYLLLIVKQDFHEINT